MRVAFGFTMKYCEKRPHQEYILKNLQYLMGGTPDINLWNHHIFANYTTTLAFSNGSNN